ncbi:PqqD family peptide modification chaperone [Oceanomicrobium pacificus]|uniref:PqqD family peptide modification chaperone n=1 Tax=Oceanomicrobium pacificus TaxID=2692916 RepID=A0A6B0U759_9RHOB|nr:PqqD family peptide modification chaperone [Oceanomicrobium pacificus]MXU66701.1 PqqD family peptide modification chaperone [Oceanomicrobium pacificus]
MVRAFLSSDWYRLAAIKPRLRGHVDIHRQTFRGKIWFIVQDHHSGKYHRITPAAQYMLALMNGHRTMQEIWEAACARFDDAPPTQSETIRLVSQLHSADLIAADRLPDLQEMGERHAKQERAAMVTRFRNPMAVRVPLFDPDRFLDATVGALRWLFTPFGFLLWLGLVGAGLVLTGLHWTALTDGFADQVLAAENLILMALAYPLVKAVHEAGHAYATKVWGGEVHEVGVMFLVFVPVPYVDASASAAFASKWRRAVVGGAGIMVELALATLGLIFWINAEPGLARAFAYNVMLIGGISTLLFNGNPLLRFDGYFVFADLLEIPNLGQRSNRYFFYLVQRYLFGMKDEASPVQRNSERGWLFFYAVAAFIYRMFISFTIALFVASKFFVIGVVLALWALGNSFVMPLLKGFRFLLAGPALRNHRGRALAVTGTFLFLLGAALFALPAPLTTVTYGVATPDTSTLVRAGTEGFVDRIAVEPGAEVAQGDPILHLSDPVLSNRIEVLERRLEAARMRLRAVLLIDQVQADVERERVKLIEGQLETLQGRIGDLVVRAPRDGAVVLPGGADLIGRLVRQGDVLGHLQTDAPARMRIAVRQDRVDLVRRNTRAVELRMLSGDGSPRAARLFGEVPQSQTVLPSAALATEGGGDVVLNPAGVTPLSTLDRVFLFDVVPDDGAPSTLVGERALVKFDHGLEPLAWRVYRAARQLFLRQFNV